MIEVNIYLITILHTNLDLTQFSVKLLSKITLRFQKANVGSRMAVKRV